MSVDPLNIESWACSDVGRVRKHNEDSYLIDRDLGLYVVADGMGGFKRGDVASGLACSVVQETVAAARRTLEHHRRRRGPATGTALEAVMRSAAQRACEEIYHASTALTGNGGRMGTTLDAVLVVGNQAFTAHVGDGRIFVVRDGEAHQITEDHSLVQQQVREGLITPEQARRARNRNVITRALGVFPSVLVDMLTVDLGPGDRLLLCSDGLHNYVGTDELVVPMVSGDNGGAEQLVGMANARGGRDNITTLVLSARAADSTEEMVRSAPAGHIDVLRRCDLFSFCTYRELVQISAVCELRTVGAGTVLFKEEDLGRECFIIKAGSVDIRRGGVTLATLGSAAYFGEMAFIDSPRRSASAVTNERTEFLVISRNEFLRLLRQDTNLASKLMWRLMHHLAQMVRSTNSKVLSGMATIELHPNDLK